MNGSERPAPLWRQMPDAGAPDHGWTASGPGARALREARVENPDGLPALEQRVASDLEYLNYPPAGWTLPHPSPGADADAALDVLIVGAGMCGQAAAFALMREGVRRLRVIDRSPRGDEGPWGTFARMETLRSPKHLTGPDLGIPSLTFRAWYEARFGPAAWSDLYKVWRLDWRDYLLWVRRMTGIPVDNEVRLTGIDAAGDGLLRAEIADNAGLRCIHARRVVLALGRDGSGMPRWPAFPSFDAANRHGRVFHASEALTPAQLRGATVAVLGAGASAFDNAGFALESGAASVSLFARRPVLPQVNKSKWTSFPGFFHGFRQLPEASRWRLLTHVFDEQVPPPFESVLRCERHPGFEARLGEAWHDLRTDPDGVRIDTARGRQRFDLAILATGFDVCLSGRRELDSLREDILIWADRVSAEQARANPEAARFPFLGDGFELRSRSGRADALGRIHLFNWGATMSHGALAGDIPGLATGASRLAGAIAAALFAEDAERFQALVRAHAEPELGPTRFHRPAG